MKQSEEVMSKAELLERLREANETLARWGYQRTSLVVIAIENAITALSSQDDVRDRALKEVAAMCILRADELNDTRSAYDGVAASELMAMSERIRALKSKPTTEERRTGEVDRRGLVGWLYDYAGKDGPPYSGTVTYADLVNFAAELDTRLGGKS